MPHSFTLLKKHLLTLAALCFYFIGSSQGVAINTDGTAPNSNAILDVKSSSKGILIPRIDYNNRPAANVETGMLIFVTANGPQGNNVFYYYDGTKWLRVKNADDKQNLSLAQDTLKLSESNYVIVGNILNLIGYYKCGSSYVQTASDVNNCGSCGNICSFPNAAASCVNSNCVLGNCATGYGNCNNVSSDGCEVNLTNNVNNCGSCGNICSFANASASCVSGNCALGNCNTGYANCNNNTADGCEVNLSNNVNNCGACGNVCNFSNAVGNCVGGTCNIASCNSGFANCNSSNADGCEINVTNNVNNCGSCGRVCSLPNATAACTSGVCTIGTCSAGYANCNSNAADGCEVNIRTDRNNCGGCGIACASGKSCVNGTCQ